MTRIVVLARNSNEQIAHVCKLAGQVKTVGAAVKKCFGAHAAGDARIFFEIVSVANSPLESRPKLTAAIAAQPGRCLMAASICRFTRHPSQLPQIMSERAACAQAAGA